MISNENIRREPNYALRFLKRHTIGVVAIILVVIVTASNPAFLSYSNITNIFSQYAPVGLMAIGMTYVIIAGGFDLSIAAIFSLSAVVAAVVALHMSPVLAFLAAVLAGSFVGYVNAVLITRFEVNPFVTTVGTGFIVTGVTYVLTGNEAFVVENSAFEILGSGRLLGFPYSGMVLVVILVAAGFALSRTIYGHVIYAVGGNPEASRLSGLQVNVIVGSTYVILGLLSGIAGYISASQLSSAQANMDPNVLFDVLTIVIVGGTPLGGGIGSIGKTILGLIIIVTISNGFVLLDINPFYQNIIKGTLIVGALVLDSVVRRKA
ncbi:MAG: ABC transporter permease [Alphaproteobacteria bacterium]|nr:ABC transporter permease [Alphaproteobacteria bacterium]